MLERWARPWARLWNGTARVVDAVFGALGRPGKLLQDFLNGAWLGHSLHPVVVDVVVGGTTVALLLQLLTWLTPAEVRTALVWTLALTWLAGLSAIVTGLTDFKDTAKGDERNMVGLHGLMNIVATGFLIGAFAALLAGADGLAGWLIVAGFGIRAITSLIASRPFTSPLP